MGLFEITPTDGIESGVHRIVVSLEEQGLIRRKTGTREFKARCIEVVHAPLESWVHIGDLASKLVESLKDEHINSNGEGTVIVDAKAFGELDVALKEASERGRS